MSVLAWDDTYKIGIEIIDEQHQQLLGILNETFNSLNTVSREELEKLVERLHNYTLLHFGTEEKLMEQAGFGDISFHKNEHEYFVNKVKEFREKVAEDSEINTAREIVYFLTTWFITHIKVTDRDAGQYILSVNA